jgi:hypothetical protein
MSVKAEPAPYLIRGIQKESKLLDSRLRGVDRLGIIRGTLNILKIIAIQTRTASKVKQKTRQRFKNSLKFFLR